MSSPAAPVRSSAWFLGGQRVPPMHGYSSAMMARKRFAENTTSLAITVGFVLPTLTNVNKRLEKHVHEGVDVPLDEIVDIFASCGKEAAKSYADRIARVSCQTALACVLIESSSPTANSMVYLWDLYPRLMQRYVGEVFALMRIPKFFAAVLGPSPKSDDVAFLEATASSMDAFGDSVKRNAIFLFGDIVVDTARTLVDTGVRLEKKPVMILKKIMARATTTLCWATGAAVGRAVGGERGEYWGEYMGTLVAPVVVTQALLLADNVRRTRGKDHRKPSASRARTHTSSGGSRKPSSSDAPAPTAA